MLGMRERGLKWRKLTEVRRGRGCRGEEGVERMYGGTRGGLGEREDEENKR